MKEEKTYCVAVCDDETIFRNQIAKMIQEYMFQMERNIDIRLFETGKELCDFCSANEVNLVFLEIQLEGMDGIQTAHFIREKLGNYEMHIVFVTCLQQYIYEIFAVHPLDFIEKPIDAGKVRNCIDFALRIQESKNVKFLYVNQYQKKYVLEKDIIAFSKNGKDVEIYLNHAENDWFRGTIKEVENRLAGRFFVKINQSTIINTDYIEDFTNDRIVMKNQKEYKVSREYKKELRKKYFGD